MMELTSTLVGAMPANALKVFVVLMLERLPVTKGYLATVTDMSDKTLAKALDQLELRGMVSRIGGHTYQIAAGVRQLPLSVEMIDAQAVDKPVDNSVDNLGDEGAEEEKSRNISDFSAHACKQESINPESIKQDPACMPESRNFSELEQALTEAGFRDPGLSRLRKQAGLTARVVRYHVQTADNLGLALYRIEHKFRVPENWERDGPDERNKYAGGEFAAFVVT
jgi:DNA-binding transcriptional regulator YhcF (GntR family)